MSKAFIIGITGQYGPYRARRCGPLPDWADAKSNQVSTDQLDRWADRIRDAKSLDAVFTERDKSTPTPYIPRADKPAVSRSGIETAKGKACA